VLTNFHHVAFRCNDAAETVKFYTEVLGLRYSHAVSADIVASTKAHDPHIHIFFELGDGSSIAFFEVPTAPAALKDPNTPDWVQHVAFQVNSEAELLDYKRRLEQAHVPFLGPVGHHDAGQQSIYFFDPNGVRLEFNLPAKVDSTDRATLAWEVLSKWEKRKAAGTFRKRSASA